LGKKRERKFLYSLFQKNGYPKSFINSCLRGNRNSPQNTGETKWIGLPYIKDVSEATARILKPFGLNVAHKPSNILGLSISQTKDQLEPLEKAGVIYSIPCSQCTKTYTGETGKKLCTRLHEHNLALKRADTNSVLWNHFSETGHDLIFKNAKILDRANTKGERLILEALHSGEETLNRHVDIDAHYTALASFIQKNRSIPQPP
jgi:hypothetical protein